MSEWPLKTLGDVFSIQNGFAFDSERFSPIGQIGLIRIRDLRTAMATETRYTGPYDSEYIVHDGDFLVGMDGEFRCYEWHGEPSLLNQRVCRLQNFDSELEPRFLLYGLNKYLKEIEDVTGYTTVKHLSSKTILGIEMPIPPIEEQQRIVALLDAATAKMDEVERLLENKSVLLKAMTDAVVDESFSPSDNWESQSVAEWSEGVLTGPFGSLVHKSDYVESGVPLVNPMNLQNGKIHKDGLKHVTKSKARELARYILREGDVVVGRRGEMGRCAVVGKDESGWLCGTGSFVIRCGTKCNPNVLAHWLSSRAGRQTLLSLSTGSTMDNLGNSDLSRLTIVLPAYDKQHSLASRIDKALEVGSILSTNVENQRLSVRKLHQSVLEAAFQGEL